MLESIAGAAMDMSAARFSVEYSMAVTKKVMDTQELAAQELLEMLPAAPSMGQYIDVYAGPETRKVMGQSHDFFYSSQPYVSCSFSITRSCACSTSRSIFPKIPSMVAWYKFRRQVEVPFSSATWA